MFESNDLSCSPEDKRRATAAPPGLNQVPDYKLNGLAKGDPWRAPTPLLTFLGLRFCLLNVSGVTPVTALGDLHYSAV